jgi:choline dehydrogenase
MHKGINLIRELVKQPAFEKLCGEEIFPGKPVQSDAELDASLNSHVYTQWHLSGTARMGSKNDKGAVVDIHGRVHGLQGIRIVDASIMPSVTNGNTNAPTIMIAEKLSDTILGIAPLPRNEAQVWQSRNYENSQR